MPPTNWNPFSPEFLYQQVQNSAMNYLSFSGNALPSTANSDLLRLAAMAPGTPFHTLNSISNTLLSNSAFKHVSALQTLQKSAQSFLNSSANNSSVSSGYSTSDETAEISRDNSENSSAQIKVESESHYGNNFAIEIFF